MLRTTKLIITVALSLILLLGLYFSIDYLIQDKPAPEPASLQQHPQQLPEDFPQIPVYPNSTLVYSYKKQENGKLGFDAYWTSEDPVNQVMAWFLEELENSGWLIIESPEDPSSDGEQFSILQKGEVALYLTVENEDRIMTEIFAEFPIRNE